MSPRKGEAIKESNGEIRDKPIYCRLPVSKVRVLDEIAASMGISRTDAISEAIDLWISTLHTSKSSIYTEDSININTSNEEEKKL